MVADPSLDSTVLAELSGLCAIMRAVILARPASWPVLALALTAAGCGRAPPPPPAAVLLNGAVHAGEWEDAAVVTEQSDVDLRVKRSGDWVYLVVILHGPRHSGIDLYLAAGDTIRMLRVSSALGQRKRGRNGTWSDIGWGENLLWTANSIGLIVTERKTTQVPLSAFEFQIHRSLLPAAPWHVRLHLKGSDVILPPNTSADPPNDHVPLHRKGPDVIVPPNTSADSPDDWLIVP